MHKTVKLTGFIKGVKYRAFLTKKLNKISLNDFDVNHSNSYGIIQTEDAEVGYSKWVSPKRTRSYPFARIYNTYNSSKILTIVPVIKDEGKDGDLDKIQYSTISWMNLLNIYIVLGYYKYAKKNRNPKQRNKNKLSSQEFDNDFIKSQIQEILDYKQSALHWNKNLIEERFSDIFRIALDAYQSISEETGVAIHSQDYMEQYLQSIIENFQYFKNISLKGSQRASSREARTSHKLEYLVDGKKPTLCIKNYLGGEYYLTADEMVMKKRYYIIQESKNSTRKALPGLNDIQDGLFKLILYSNIDSLQINGEIVSFTARLKLTGNGIKERIIMPCSNEELENFISLNSALKKGDKVLLRSLLLEVQMNSNIEVEVAPNFNSKGS